MRNHSELLSCPGGVYHQFEAIEKRRCIFIFGADSKTAIVPVVRRQYTGLIVFPRCIGSSAAVMLFECTLLPPERRKVMGSNDLQ